MNNITNNPSWSPHVAALISGAGLMLGYMAMHYVQRRLDLAVRCPTACDETGEPHHGDWEYGPGPSPCDVNDWLPEDMCAHDYWSLHQTRALHQRDQEIMKYLQGRVRGLTETLRDATAYTNEMEDWRDQAEEALAHAEGCIAGMYFKEVEREYDLAQVEAMVEGGRSGRRQDMRSGLT